MFEHILVPLDGTPAGDAALSWVRRLALSAGSDVLGLAVGAAQCGMRHTVERLVADGIRARAAACAGAVCAAILRAIDEEEITLCVWPARTEGTAALLSAIPVPVVTLPSGARDLPSRILVALDGAPRALDAVPPAIQWARLARARIALAHVDPWPGAFPPNLAAERNLRIAAAALREAGFDSPVERPVGDPLDEPDGAAGILRACRAGRYDAIALAGSGDADGPAARLIRRSPVPVLFLRWNRCGPPVPHGANRNSSSSV